MKSKASSVLSLAFAIPALLLGFASAHAQSIRPTTDLITGLQRPLGIVQSNQRNLLVAETGTFAPNSGRISIVDLHGVRRTLLDGLPSGISDVGDPDGPDGLFLRGRTLYVAIGAGNSFLSSQFPNPTPASPLFGSVLAVHFSANVEKQTQHGFMLTLADHQRLAAGEKLTLANNDGEQIAIELIANFPDFTTDSITPSGYRSVNPFALCGVGDQLYVTDGGQNLVWQVDIPTGAFSILTRFPSIPNPIAGPPRIDAVPTGIVYSEGKLLVALFQGFPFPVGSSLVEQVDLETGTHTPFITGLKATIGILPIKEGADIDYLVLQHASMPGPPPSPASQPGVVRRFGTPGDPPTLIANTLSRPTAMTLDEKTDTLYVTEYITGRIVAISMAD